MDLVFLGKHRHFWSWSVCAWFNRHFLTLLDYLNTIGGYSVLPWRHRRKFAIRMNVFFSRTSSQIIWNTLPVFVFICSATSLAGPISEDIIHSWASLLFLRCLSSFPPHHFLRHTVGLSLPGTFLNAVTELFFTIFSYQNVLLCFAFWTSPLYILVLTQPGADMRHKEGHQLLSSTLSKAAQTPQDTKAPEHRQTTVCSLLALYSQLSIPHSTPCSSSAGLWFLQCVSGLSGSTKLPSGKRGVTWTVSFAHMLTHSAWNTILLFASLSPNSSTKQVKPILPTKSLLNVHCTFSTQ